MFKTRKVVIVGAGHVGSHVALALIQSGEADDIVLIDILKEKAIGQALDLDDCVSGSLCGKDVSIRAGSYEELHDADIMVMAFGRSRRPGETRLDMFDDSIKMANEVVSHLKQVDFRGIMISISNPADIICEYIRRQMDWQPSRCFCTGTSLETYRLLRVLSKATGYSRPSLYRFFLIVDGSPPGPPPPPAVLFTASVWVSMVIPALSSGHVFLSKASPFCSCAGNVRFWQKSAWKICKRRSKKPVILKSTAKAAPNLVSPMWPKCLSARSSTIRSLSGPARPCCAANMVSTMWRQASPALSAKTVWKKF